MTKTIIVCALAVACCFPAFSQPYIRINSGYALPLNSELIGEEEIYVYDPDTGEESGSYKGVYGSLGSGITFSAAFGNTFGGGNLGYDLEVSYLIGRKYEVTSIYEYVGFSEEKTVSESKSQSFQFSPSLSFTATTGKLQPYTRIGPVLAKTTLKFEENYEESGFGNYVVGYELNGGISIGIKGALGVNFSPTNKVQFFSEVSFISMSYAPTQGEITKFTVDGDNQLDDIPAEDRKIDFEKEYSFSDDSEENVDIRETYSMGSVSIQVGVKLKLK